LKNPRIVIIRYRRVEKGEKLFFGHVAPKGKREEFGGNGGE
jgi:hypothetical protein